MHMYVVCNKLFTHVTIIIFIVSTALVTNTSVRHVLLFYFWNAQYFLKKNSSFLLGDAIWTNLAIWCA